MKNLKITMKLTKMNQLVLKGAIDVYFEEDNEIVFGL